jgi:NAD(P)-dependent dehydrogenase (short-subunit alcohol dehydrogenase family)
MKKKQKTILITGCSSGIGLDAAMRLQSHGWLVLATCRSDADCVSLREKGLHSFVLDYADSGSIQRGWKQAMDITGGELDVLFNNGAYALPGAIEDIPVAGLKENFEANFFGWHELSCLALKVMRAQENGRILINSSVLGFAALRFRGSYNATKFALEGWADTLRLELANSPIKIVLIEPGPIRTRIRINSLPHFQKWINWQASPLKRTYEEALIPRLNAPEDGPKDRFELPVSAVSDAVLHACTTRQPKIRYRITSATKLAALFKWALPAQLWDKLAVRL